MWPSLANGNIDSGDIGIGQEWACDLGLANQNQEALVLEELLGKIRRVRCQGEVLGHLKTPSKVRSSQNEAELRVRARNTLFF